MVGKGLVPDLFEIENAHGFLGSVDECLRRVWALFFFGNCRAASPFGFARYSRLNSHAMARSSPEGTN